MGFKDFITKKMLERQLKGLPESQKQAIIKIVENNPELFKKISEEIEQKKKDGQDEMMASVSVMKKYQSEIQEVMKKM